MFGPKEVLQFFPENTKQQFYISSGLFSLGTNFQQSKQSVTSLQIFWLSTIYCSSLCQLSDCHRECAALVKEDKMKTRLSPVIIVAQLWLTPEELIMISFHHHHHHHHHHHLQITFNTRLKDKNCLLYKKPEAVLHPSFFLQVQYSTWMLYVPDRWMQYLEIKKYINTKYENMK